ERTWLKETRIKPSPLVQDYLVKKGSSSIKGGMNLEELLKRPEIAFTDLQKLTGVERDVLPEVAEELEIQIKYAGYLQKQEAHVARMEKMENKRIPDGIDYDHLSGL